MNRLEKYRKVLKLALPAVGEMLLYMLIWTVDTLMVGKYGGRVAVSAVGLSGQILYTVSAVFSAMGIGVALTSLVSRKIGEGEEEEANIYGSIGFFMGAAISLVLGVLFYTVPQEFLKFANARGEVLVLGSIYLKISSFALLMTIWRGLLNGIIRGAQNTKIPLYTTGVMTVVNLGLDYLLIFGKMGFPEMGVKGAAIATVAANLVGFLYTIFYLQKHSCISLGSCMSIKSSHLIHIKEKWWEIMRIALPASFQEGAISISRLAAVFMIMILGETAFSANQIALTVESISFMPGWGFAVAATSLAGLKMGEKNYEEVEDMIGISLHMGVAVMGLIAFIFILFPEFLISLFIKIEEKEVIALGATCLMIASLEQIPLAYSMIVSGALRGMGDTKTPFYISVFSHWFIRLPLIYYLVYLKRYPVYYVWFVQIFHWSIDGGLLYIFYRKKISSLIRGNLRDKLKF
jgi:putative MATE family efflux protein